MRSADSTRAVRSWTFMNSAMSIGAEPSAGAALGELAEGAPGEGRGCAGVAAGDGAASTLGEGLADDPSSRDETAAGWAGAAAEAGAAWVRDEGAVGSAGVGE